MLKILQVPGTLVQYRIKDDSASPTITTFFFSFQISPTDKSRLCCNGRANVVLLLPKSDSFGSSFCLLFAIACSQKKSASPLMLNHKQKPLKLHLNLLQIPWHSTKIMNFICFLFYTIIINRVYLTHSLLEILPKNAF